MKKSLAIVVYLLTTVIVLGSTPAWALTAEQEAKLLASDAAAENLFGWRVALDADTAIIGAVWDNDNGWGSGSAYVFTRTDGVWTEQAKLLPDDGTAGEQFGWSVAFDGNSAVIGANRDDDNGYESGSAYVFTRTDGVWTEQAKLLPDDGAAGDYFGSRVALDGDTAVIGAAGDDDNGQDSGSVYVFTLTGGVWTEQAKLLPADGAADDRFGLSVALDGDTAVIGAYGDDDNGEDSGSAYVFTRTAGVWTEQAKLLPADGAGSDKFGGRVALDGDTTVIGAAGYSPGSAYVFTRTSGVWNEKAKLLPADDTGVASFGTAVALDGDTAVIGAHDDDNGPYSGSTFVFTRTAGVWTEQAKLLASDGERYDDFGTSVALDGDTAVIGAYGDDDNGNNSGSAYVFRLIPADADGDGVNDDADVCLDTTIPETVPTNHLQVNRWALVDDDDVFDTTPPPGGGGGPEFEFDLQDTGGCSCEQIIDRMDLGWGHTKFGCSLGTMLQWINDGVGFDRSQVELEVQQRTGSAFQQFTESVGERSPSPSEATTDAPPRRQQSLIRGRTPRRDNDKK